MEGMAHTHLDNFMISDTYLMIRLATLPAWIYPRYERVITRYDSALK
jgi:hypothetical protein